MKKVVIFLLFFGFVSSYAQEDGDGQNQGFDAQKELERQVKIPNTPEAQAFEKYGNTSVSMYTGAPNISVPIYTIAGRELNVPISLTYDATGVKVNQMATQVGLSWNLNAGGRISRTVNGLVDDYISSSLGYLTLGNPHSTVGGSNIVNLSSGEGVATDGSTGKTLPELVAMYKNPPSTFNSLPEGKQYFHFLKDLSENKFDTQPDYFSFNALGYSDTFVYDPEGATFIALKNPRTKVTADYISGSLASWIVTTDDGTKFYFEAAEVTHSESNTESDPNTIFLQEYNSSWVLTKIVSSHYKDTYVFDYKDIAKTDQESYIIGSATTVYEYISTYRLEPQTTENYVGNRYAYDAKVLEKITHNNHEILSISFKNRWDQKLEAVNTNGSAIDKITIYKRHDTDSATPENDVLKQFQLRHGYFGIPNSAQPEDYADAPWNLRLKLEGIDIQSGLENTLSSYNFEYITPEGVPSRISLAQDYLGLYNGASNENLYVASDALDAYSSIKGGNRNPNFNYAQIGTLSKIMYPTGGHTTFEYEPHKVLEYTASDPEDITYAYLAVAGGTTNPQETCGNCCIDEFGYISRTNIQSQTFSIDDDLGGFKIDFQQDGIAGKAYLIKIGDVPKNNVPVVPYIEIIDQSNCHELQEIVWSSFHSDSSVYLDRGTYQLTLVKETGTIAVKIHREEQEDPSYRDVLKAGIRVKNIKDYSAQNILASEKEYKYVDALDEGSEIVEIDGVRTVVPNLLKSSGVALFTPAFISESKFRTVAKNSLGSQELMIKTRYTRPTSFSGGDRPHVAYRRVFEIQKAGETNNGYQVHDFNTGYYNGVNTDLHVNYYRSDVKTGKEKRLQVFNTSDEKQAEEKTDYTETQYFGSSTLFPHGKPEDNYYFIDIYKDITITDQDVFRYTFRMPITSPGNGGLVTFEYPDECHPERENKENNYCFSHTSGYSVLGSRKTYAQGKTGGVLYKENTTIYPDRIYKNQSYSAYNTTGDSPNYLLKERKSITSEGEDIKQQFFYPESGALKDANIVANPIETKTYKNDRLLFSQKTIYADLSILPSKVQTAKGARPLEDRLYFERYENNNVVQVKQADGTTTVYIWGYWNTQPIAKIDNATYDQVASYVSNLQRLSHLDSDRTLGAEGAEGALRTALNALRSLPALSNAQVTTYTYDPLIGVTSITDPRGQVVYYQYDEYHRLEHIKDQNGKIVQHHEYQYKK